MSGTKTGNFKVVISATDNATPALDRLVQRLEKLTTPTKALSGGFAKLGDTSGVIRLSQGMQALSSRSFDAFRSLDRISPALGNITGAASLAGMAKLVQNWSQLGTQVQNTSQRLGIPVNQLTSLQSAARLAGSSAEAMGNGLATIDEQLRGAAFRSDGDAIQAFKILGVSIFDSAGKVRTGADAFGDLAEGFKKLYDVGNRGGAKRAADMLGIEPLLPLLQKGRQGVRDLQAEAAQLGGVISPAAAERAKDLNKSFESLWIAVDGVGNRLGDKWGATVKPFIDGTAKWIGANKELADSYGNIGGAMLALGAIKPAAWLARFLGMNALVTPAILATPLALSGDTNPNATPDGFMPGWKPDNTGAVHNFHNDIGLPLSRWWGGHAPSWLQGSWSSGAGPDDAVPPQVIKRPIMGSVAYGEMLRVHDFFRGKNYNEAQTSGFLSAVSGESGFNPRAWNADHTSYGYFQMTADRLKRMQDYYHVAEPSADQQLDWAYRELQTTESATNRALLGTNDSGTAGRIVTGFERPAGLHQRERERALGAQQFDGQVAVTVKLQGAPPGTTAKATSSGVATVSPPIVATAMQGY